jgi:hypothetical protein
MSGPEGRRSQLWHYKYRNEDAKVRFRGGAGKEEAAAAAAAAEEEAILDMSSHETSGDGNVLAASTGGGIGIAKLRGPTALE